jgi:hypothetical protein
MRKLLLLLAAVTASLAGVAAASALTDSTNDPPSPPTAEDRRPAVGTDDRSAVARPNGGPPWTVLTYRSASGKLCAVVGQLVDGEVGRIDQGNGRFHKLDKSEQPPCQDFEQDLHVSRFTRAAGGDVALVWGVAPAGVTEVAVTSRAGQGTQSAAPAARRAWITAFDGFHHQGFDVEYRQADGGSSKITTPDAPPPLTEEQLDDLRRDAQQQRSPHSHSAR